MNTLIKTLDNTSQKEMGAAFKEIIQGYIEGVDYITIQEKEPRIWHDGEPDGCYNFDFEQLEIEARRSDESVVLGRNGGLYGAFDPESHTMILTARTDMIDVRYGSLYIPFSDQMHEPADPMKAAAINYQEELSKRNAKDDYGESWPHFDQSDTVAFLKAVLPSLKTEEERAKVNLLIEKNARYTVTSRGYQKGRNDQKAWMIHGQKFIAEKREALDQKEISSLALKHLKWERGLTK